MKKIKQELPALYLCLKDPQTPWLPKMLAWIPVAYALSPIDLIPDFIIVALQRRTPHLSLGLLTFMIGGTIIIGSIFVYHDFYAFIYGLVYTIVTSLFLDFTSLCIRKRVA